MTIKQTRSYQEDDYTVDIYTALESDTGIGGATVMVSEDGAYVERIDIDEAHRGKGHGTAFLLELSGIYCGIYLAPDSEDSRRLYERLGRDASSRYWMVDQGFGVYEI